MTDFLLEIPSAVPDSGLKQLFVKSPPFVVDYSDSVHELVMWGDPVGGDEFVTDQDVVIDPVSLISRVRGHYYFLILNRKEREFFAGNSLFSILPIYYCEKEGEVVLSGNALELGRYAGLDTVSRRFVLETVLFNYPLFNHSIIERINLLPSNSHMEVRQGSVKLVRHTATEDLFSADPLPWRRAGESVNAAFLDTVKKYIPAGKYLNAFTGGLDSRTLVAAGLAAGGDMLCFSFGAPGSKDVEIPDLVTGEAGLPYLKILLDDDYVRMGSLDNGIEFILNASGTASFVRGHYLYAAKILKRHSDCMITGNFGSELFRAANVRGVTLSPNLVSLFSSNSADEAFEVIRGSSQFSSLAKGAFDEEWDQLKQSLLTLPCFNRNYRELTRNERFYVFIFEEVFRKYFGAEMVNQYIHLKNRTPFLDAEFMKIILGTGYAGVYSEFFEKNPFKRYKGQVLYAQIIREAAPQLGKMITDKGYCPDDLLTLAGRLKVVRGYVRKKSRPLDPATDLFSVGRAFRHNAEFFRKVFVRPGFFNQEIMADSGQVANSTLYTILSLSIAMAAAEDREIPLRRNPKNDI